MKKAAKRKSKLCSRSRTSGDLRSLDQQDRERARPNYAGDYRKPSNRWRRGSGTGLQRGKPRACVNSPPNAPRIARSWGRTQQPENCTSGKRAPNMPTLSPSRVLSTTDEGRLRPDCGDQCARRAQSGAPSLRHDYQGTPSKRKTKRRRSLLARPLQTA